MPNPRNQDNPKERADSTGPVCFTGFGYAERDKRSSEDGGPGGYALSHCATGQQEPDMPIRIM